MPWVIGLTHFLVGTGVPTSPGVTFGNLASAQDHRLQPVATDESPDDQATSVPFLDDADFRLYPLRPPTALPVPDTDTDGFEIRQELQHEESVHVGPTDTRAQLSGSIRGRKNTPWLFEWSSDVSCGSTAASPEDVQEGSHFGLTRFTVSRQVGDHLFLRAGRQRADVFAGIGNLDGVHGQLALGRHFQAGVLAGFRPSALEEIFSFQEPLALSYVTVEAGEPKEFHYRGAIGLMGDVDTGDLDRWALLLEQETNLASKLKLRSSSEVDVGPLFSETETTPQPLRENLQVISPVTSLLTLHAGFDYYSTPDIRKGHDSGTWRYRLGGTRNLTPNLDIGGEFSFPDSLDRPGQARKWRVSLRRTGLPGLRQARLTATAHTLDAYRGYAGTISPYIPLWKQKLFLSPAITFGLRESDRVLEDLRITRASFLAQWLGAEGPAVRLGAHYLLTGHLNGTFVDVGIHHYW